MLIGCFCGMVDWRKCACLIFSGDYYQVSNKILFYWSEMCSDHNKYNTMSQSLALKNLFNHSLPSSEFFAFPENCCERLLLACDLYARVKKISWASQKPYVPISKTFNNTALQVWVRFMHNMNSLLLLLSLHSLP